MRKSIGARLRRVSSISSSVCESLPPDRHTITVSPASIMLKSAIALPTWCSSRPLRRLKLVEWRSKWMGCAMSFMKIPNNIYKLQFVHERHEKHEKFKELYAMNCCPIGGSQR